LEQGGFILAIVFFIFNKNISPYKVYKINKLFSAINKKEKRGALKLHLIFITDCRLFL